MSRRYLSSEKQEDARNHLLQVFLAEVGEFKLMTPENDLISILAGRLLSQLFKFNSSTLELGLAPN